MLSNTFIIRWHVDLISFSIHKYFKARHDIAENRLPDLKQQSRTSDLC